MITLGIIGVVAALTLPALINDKQNKELEAKYKKVYSVMQQALLKMSYDEGQEITKENYNSPTTFLIVISVPFGVPVEPDVYNMYARSSGVVGVSK